MKENRYQVWIFAVLYALLLTYIVPWSVVTGREFADIFSYVSRIAYLAEGGKEFPHVGIAWLLDEPLWRLILRAIGYLFDDHRLALYIISFIAMLFTASFLFKRVHYYIGMILMFNPMVIDLFLGQMRSALAFSILLLAYDATSKKQAIILIIFAILIHSSMPLFIAIYFLLYKLNQHVESKKFYLISLFTALFFALFMQYGLELVLTFLGDRHAGAEEPSRGSSLAYSIVWFMIGVIIATFATFSNEKERVLAAYAITMLGFFFFASIFNIYAQRFVALSMPLIIISVSYLPKHFRQGTYAIFFAYNLLMFKYWIANG